MISQVAGPRRPRHRRRLQPAATQLLTGRRRRPAQALGAAAGADAVADASRRRDCRGRQRRRQARLHRRRRQDRPQLGPRQARSSPSGSSPAIPTAVSAVAVSPNGQLLASAGDDGIDPLLEPGQRPADRDHRRPRRGRDEPVLQPQQPQLLSASADGSVKLWQLPAAAPKLFAHPDKVTTAVLSPDGTKLLTGCADKQVRLWNLATGAVERPFAGNTLAVLSRRLQRQRGHVAAGGADKSLTVWTAADAKEVKKFANLPAAVQAVAFSPDGKSVAAGLADNSIHLFDLPTGKDVKTLAGHTGPVTAPAIHAQGRTGIRFGR